MDGATGNNCHSDDVVVALLLPSLVDSAADRDALRKSLNVAAAKLRVLVCVPEGPAEPLLSMLTDLGVSRQILLGNQVEKPPTGEFILSAPPGMSRDDLVEFALALCDVVLVSKGHENRRLARHASRTLGKTLVAVGSAVHLSRPDIANVTEYLDPEAPGWPSWGKAIFGRAEQAILEILALPRWRDENNRRNRFWRSFGRRWPRSAYFAPPDWKDLCPDKAAVEGAAPLIDSFEAMDRSALHGSRIHRDITWITHFGAAFAVLFAVAGQVAAVSHAEYDSLAWSWCELVVLVVVTALVFGVRRTRLQERWTACRLGAEQLRIARMSLPLLVLPPALATEDTSLDEEQIDFELVALAQVKRAVRQQGLPRVDYSSLTPAETATWLQLIVADQTVYHERNHQTLERAEESLSRLTTLIFCLSIAAVLAVLLWFHSHHPVFLLATAAGPAFAAALHGAGMRLGIVHRSALSREMKEQLEEIGHSLQKLIRAAPSSTKGWRDVRETAYHAAGAMGAENSSWHHLVRRYRDELP